MPIVCCRSSKPSALLVARRYLVQLFAQDKAIDTLVLGCTHYPLLSTAFQRALEGEVTLVDSAWNCAVSVQQLLDQKDMRAPETGRGGLETALTDAPDNFLRVAKEALELDIGEVEVREVLYKPSSV